MVEKSFVGFYLVYNRFRFKILRPTEQKLKKVIIRQIKKKSCFFYC